jgi:hypothetical protein
VASTVFSFGRPVSSSVQVFETARAATCDLRLDTSAFLFSLYQTVTKALKMAHVLDESASYHLPAGVVSVLDAAIDFVYSLEPLVAKTVVLGTINYPS